MHGSLGDSDTLRKGAGGRKHHLALWQSHGREGQRIRHEVQPVVVGDAGSMVEEAGVHFDVSERLEGLRGGIVRGVQGSFRVDPAELLDYPLRAAEVAEVVVYQDYFIHDVIPSRWPPCTILHVPRWYQGIR